MDDESYTRKDVDVLFKLSEKMSEITKTNYVPYAKNKILVEAFFEPSTRTSLSFECAMKRLGGNVIQFNSKSSSKQKGESDMDTLQTLSNYGDAIVLRHPKNNIYDKAKTKLEIPIINGGNGNAFHPTQALLDLYTTYKHFNNDFKFKKYLFVGDIKNSRTIHSFVKLLNLYPNTNLYFFPYKKCEPSQEYINDILRIHGQYESKYNKIVLNTYDINYKDYDVIYISRYQKERHTKEKAESPKKNKWFKQFTYENAKTMHDEAIILHPLPRNNELDVKVDTMKQAHYFKALEYSIELRMAILEQVFECQVKNKNKGITNYIKPYYTYGTLLLTCGIYMICVLKNKKLS